MKRNIFPVFALAAAMVLIPSGLVAGDVHDLSSLREICPAGRSVKVDDTYLVGGVVISDWRSPNMELNPNVAADVVNTEVNDGTAYVQQEDASMGVRVVFREAGENRLCRYDGIVMDLKGCTLTREADPDRITIGQFAYSNVVSRTDGDRSSVPIKEKTIAELADADIYTYVSLRDVEMVFKNGGYTDVYEPYMQPLPQIQGDGYGVSGRMDGWAALVRDGAGSCMYMLVNTLCPWRRNPVPRGVGVLNGILVNTDMPRYGGCMGRYSIRPVDEADIAVTSRKSPWKLLTAWILDGSNGQKLDFEVMGEVDGLWKNGRKGDRVLNDAGTRAYLWTNSNSAIHVDSDLNATDGKDKGFVHDGAILFKGPTAGWYAFDKSGKAESNKSFFIEFPAKKVKGTAMCLSFSWSAGDQKMDHDWGFPANWTVMCSVDDGSWVRLRECATGKKVFSLRGQPYWDGKSAQAANGYYYRTGFDCGMGNQQRSFMLPKEAIGASKVVVRITPANSTMYSIRKHPEAPGECNVKIKQSFRGTTVIRFGEIKIEYR